MVVSNSTRKEKLKYNDIRDLILFEEIRRSKSRNSNRSKSKSRSGQLV